MTLPQGSGHPSAKINEDQALEIKQLLKQGKLTQGQIAAQFGVDRTTVCNIKRGKTWQHVTLPKPVPVSAEPVECTHGGRHEHGTYIAYNMDKCRCTDCKAAHAHKARTDRKMKAYGRYQYPQLVGDVRGHVLKLRRYGIKPDRLAELSGVAECAIRRIMHAPDDAVVFARTAQRIYAVQPDISHARDGSAVDPTGTRRRLQALMAMGWDLGSMASAMGLHKATLSRAIKGFGVYAGTAKAVSAYYDLMWRHPAPESHGQKVTKTLAARRGYYPPLAWDDDEIDDPKARPHGEWKAVA